MTNSKYKVLGTNEDQDYCSICGKKHLSKVVWIENEDGELFHCGTTCAKKLTTWEPNKIVSESIKADQINKDWIRYWNEHPMIIAEREDMIKTEFDSFVTALLKNENHNDLVIKGVLNG